MHRDHAPLTFLFAGGGTGGHLFPGIAVAEELQARAPGCRAVFVGSGREIEAGILTAAGLEHRVLPVEPSTTLRHNPLRFLWRLWRSCRAARDVLQAERPAVVIGLGGFASVPVVREAARLGLPTVLLEQNVVPGRATRWLCRRASVVCLSFEATRGRLPRRTKTCVTGNPVRRPIAALHATALTASQGETAAALTPDLDELGIEDSARRVLLVLGGSQGATAINEAILLAAQTMKPALDGWLIVHQTGAAQADEVRRRYAELQIEALVEPFFSDLAGWYRQTGVAVSRAGATTLAELACAGCPAVLVPYPHSIGDHQLWNARICEAAGGACTVEQRLEAVDTARALTDALRSLLADPALRAARAQAMLALARPHAAAEAADRVLELAR